MRATKNLTHPQNTCHKGKSFTSPSAVHHIGLTGGIASGKSTVAKMLADMGAVVIDADTCAHKLTSSHGEAIPIILSIFGEQMINPDGALNRIKMRELIFSNKKLREQLEAILHPLILRDMQQELYKAYEQKRSYIVFDVPLLIEHNGKLSDYWKSKIDTVLVIDCSEQTQCLRVMQKSGINKAQARAIIAAQTPRETRIKAADEIIDNNNISLQQLKTKVQIFAKSIGLIAQ